MPASTWDRRFLAALVGALVMGTLVDALTAGVIVASIAAGVTAGLIALSPAGAIAAGLLANTIWLLAGLGLNVAGEEGRSMLGILASIAGIPVAGLVLIPVVFAGILGAISAGLASYTLAYLRGAR